MGASKFYYLPAGANNGGAWVAVDVGRRIQDRVGPTPILKQTHQEGFTGVQTSTMYGGGAQIRIRHTWNRGSGGDELRRELVSMLGHLRRGGCVAFVEDDDYGYAAFGNVRQRRRKADMGPNLLKNLSGAVGTGLEGRELWLASDPGTYVYEHKLCESVVSHPTTGIREITFDTVPRLSYGATRWQLVREYGSYPALRMPASLRQSDDQLLHDHEMVFRLDLALEDDPVELERLFDAGVVYDTPGEQGPGGGVDGAGGGPGLPGTGPSPFELPYQW